MPGYWDSWTEVLEMAKKNDDTPADLFMQFKDLEGRTNASDSETLREVSYPTGLSIRAPLLWLVHLLEFQMPTADLMVVPDEHVIYVALSTIAGLTAMPNLGQKGTIGTYEIVLGHGAAGNEGGFVIEQPSRQSFLPPVPIASPNLSIYARSAPDISTLRGLIIDSRIGFTTAPIEAETYAEIAEVWSS